MIKPCIYRPEYTTKLLSKTMPIFTIPAGLLTAKLCADKISQKQLLTDTFERENQNIVTGNIAPNPEEEFETRKAGIIEKIKQNKNIQEEIEFEKINKFNISLIENILTHPEWLEKEIFSTCFNGIIRTTKDEALTKATSDYINKVFEHPEILDNEDYALAFKYNVTDASPKYSEKDPLSLLPKMTLCLARSYKYPELLKMNHFLSFLNVCINHRSSDTINESFDAMDRLFCIYEEMNTPPDFKLMGDLYTGLHANKLIKPLRKAIDKVYELRGVLQNNTLKIIDALLHNTRVFGEFNFKCFILNDDSITEEDINARVEIIEHLVNNPDFSCDMISKIVNVVDKENISLSKELCNKEDFPRELILDIVGVTNDKNISLSKELCNKEDFPRELIKDIVRVTNDKNISLSRELCNKEDFPRELIKDIVRVTNDKNISLSKELCDKEDFPRELIKDIVGATNDKNISLSRELCSDELMPWFKINAKNKLSIDEMIILYPTQEKLNAEKNAKIQKQKEFSSKQADKITQLVEICGYPKVAGYYSELCKTEGIFDSVKYDAVCKLAKTGVGIKDCKNIFSLATGNHLSGQEGVFRPEIIDDFITIRKNGIKRIDLAINLSAMKNMQDAELKSRFNNDTRKEFVTRIDKLDDKVKDNLTSLDIDVAGICNKVINGINIKAKINPQGEKSLNPELRQYSDIDGMEKVLLDRFKDEINQSIWQNPEVFKQWAEQKLSELVDFDKNKNYTATGSHSKINELRKQGVADWYKYLKEESNHRDDIFTQLFVMDGITKEMRPNNEISPPAVSHETFETVFNSLLQKVDKTTFSQIYAAQIRKDAIKEFGKSFEIVDGVEGQWVSIPKTEKGNPDYIKHLAMVKALSEGSCWCLKSEANAPSYLKKGDLHFFVNKEEKAVVAINEDQGIIKEIQRRYKQDSTIPVPYTTVIEQWAKGNNYSFGDYGKKMESALGAKPKFDKLKDEINALQEQITVALKNNKDATPFMLEIFNKLEFGASLKYDGTIILEKYTPIMPEKYTLSDLGIDEDLLMNNVSEIHSNINLEGSRLTKAPNLRNVTETLKLGEMKISDLRSLESLNGKNVTWIK